MRYAQIEDIKQLIRKPKDSKAISIFMPTHRISLPHNLRADRVRMKNAIRDIVARLEKEGLDNRDIQAYVKKLHDLHKDGKFWKYCDNGLAVYVQKDKLTYYDLPIEINSSVHIGDSFIISPLLAGYEGKYSYFVLDLNLDQPRVFLASQSGIDEVISDVMPGALEQALRIDEYQQQLQHGTSRGAEHDAHHHGHGAEKDNKRKDILRYYRLIDKTLRDKLLKNSTLPLIIAADRHSADTYKQVANYSHIYDKIIEGNYQRAGKDELHEKSWEVMCERIEAQENLFKRMFEQAKYRDERQALVRGEHVRNAARQGRIATLAISIIQRTYDSVVNRMERRFKIELPSNIRQLKNIENTARDVIRTGGDITTLLYGDANGSNDTYIKAITR